MQKWEYKYLYINGERDEIYIDGKAVAKGDSIKAFSYVQQLGQEGCELVSVETDEHNRTFFLKRPIE